MTLTEAADMVGAIVVYAPRTGKGQRGRITRVTDRYVFVRYDGYLHSKATAPELLTVIDA